ncbi:hypothetical protein DM02DRAFT_544466, partial [Periconia macrospinosa]
ALFLPITKFIINLTISISTRVLLFKATKKYIPYLGLEPLTPIIAKSLPKLN